MTSLRSSTVALLLVAMLAGCGHRESYSSFWLTQSDPASIWLATADAATALGLVPEAGSESSDRPDEERRFVDHAGRVIAVRLEHSNVKVVALPTRKVDDSLRRLVDALAEDIRNRL